MQNAVMLITSSDIRRTPRLQFIRRFLVFYENVLNSRRFVLLRGGFTGKTMKTARRFKRALRDKLTLRTGMWGQRKPCGFRAG